MESLIDALYLLQKKLEKSRIDSAAIGALALCFWGKTRLTRDIDVKVLLSREEATRLLVALQTEYTPISDNPLHTLERFGMLFFRGPGGVRIDILLSDVEFDVEAIRRSKEIEARPGICVRVCSPEDLIIYKIISTRPQDHADAESVIRRQGSKIDSAYIMKWLERFEKALNDSTLIETFKRMC